MKRLFPLLLFAFAACSYPGKVDIIHRKQYDIVNVTAYGPEQFANYFDTLRIDRSKILFVLNHENSAGETEHYSIFISK